jgi:hypothetical protein
MDVLKALLEHQHGVVSRRQVLAAGQDDDFIRQRLRRNDWARVHTGVFVDHTGELSWSQRAWAAVLFYWPAALCAESALIGFRVRSSEPARRGGGHLTAIPLGDHHAPGLVHVAVDQTRRVRHVEGIEVHRVVGFAHALHPTRQPPTLRLEYSLLDVASAAHDDATAIAVLGDACQAGRTTPNRLAAALRERPRLPRRAFLLEVLVDVAAGAYSVLEHRYLTRVERPHGLPTGRRQRRVMPGRTVAYRDVEYLGLRTVIELDGRLGHEATEDRWDDMDRDIDSAIAGDTTVRVGWGHVIRSCRTAASVGRLLQARGWRGAPRPCGPSCDTSAVPT